MTMIDYQRVESERDRVRSRHLRVERPASSARGVHHVALVCSDVEQTIQFYQELLELPLTDMFDNRDHKGSSHVFFDIGNGNLLAFVDLPELNLGPYEELLGGLHHLALSVTPERWQRLRDKLDAAGVDYQVASGVSLRLRDPDGVRVELLADPLGEMYAVKVR